MSKATQKIAKDKIVPKKRFSGSMEGWLIEFVNEEAKKEDRSFSDMVGRLINEARKYRIGLVSDENIKRLQKIKSSTKN